MRFSAEVFRARLLVDISDTKAASVRYGDTDGLGVLSVVICSGFARIATAQSDRKIKTSQTNMIQGL